MGFELTRSAQIGMITVFALYSALVIGIGLFVRWGSKGSSASEKVASFFTGSGNLGPVALGLLLVTNMASSGAMIGGPGLGYGIGFIWSIAVYTGFICTFIVLGSVGKKMAIMGHRTNAQTVLQLLRHRYDSKAVSLVMGITSMVFLVPYCASQFAGGAKLFAVVSGTGNYYLGLIIFSVVTLLYTISGGIKSLAKVAVVQGVIMFVSVIALFIGTRLYLVDQYGSFQAAMEFVERTNPMLFNANVWTPLYFFGTCLLMSWAMLAMPNSLMTTLTYKKSSAMITAIVIGIIVQGTIQFVMSGLGPLGYAANQHLSAYDFVNPYLTATMLPSWMSGLVVAGTAAAIQSTVAGFLVIIASTIMKDIYKDIIKPSASDTVIVKGNMVCTVVAVVLAFIVACDTSNPYVQMLVNFAIGGIVSGFMFPALLGVYWRRATAAGAVTSCLGGFVGYIVAHLLSTGASTKAAYAALTNNAHPVLFGLGISLILMIIVSMFTKKVRKGIFEVWFGASYSEEYAHILNSGK